MSVVLYEESADFIMTGAASERKKFLAHEGWLSAQKDNSTGSVMIFSKDTKQNGVGRGSGRPEPNVGFVGARWSP